MIIGIGVDMVDIERFEGQIARSPRLMERLFTPHERELPLRSLAARYAAKESLIKALGGSDGVRWQEIEVPRLGSGARRSTSSQAARPTPSMRAASRTRTFLASA